MKALLLAAVLVVAGCVTDDAERGRDARHLDQQAEALQGHNGFAEWLEERVTVIAADVFQDMMIEHWGKIVAALLALERAKKHMDDRKAAKP